MDVMIVDAAVGIGRSTQHGEGYCWKRTASGGRMGDYFGPDALVLARRNLLLRSAKSSTCHSPLLREGQYSMDVGRGWRRGRCGWSGCLCRRRMPGRRLAR